MEKADYWTPGSLIGREMLRTMIQPMNNKANSLSPMSTNIFKILKWGLARSEDFMNRANLAYIPWVLSPYYFWSCRDPVIQSPGLA